MYELLAVLVVAAAINLVFQFFCWLIYISPYFDTEATRLVKETFARTHPELLLEGVKTRADESHRYVVSVDYQIADGIVGPTPFLLYSVSKEDGNAVELLPSSEHSVYFPLGRK